MAGDGARKRGFLSFCRFLRCLLILIPFWGVVHLHKTLILDIPEDYSALQGILELPSLTQDAFAPLPGVRLLMENKLGSNVNAGVDPGTGTGMRKDEWQQQTKETPSESLVGPPRNAHGARASLPESARRHKRRNEMGNDNDQGIEIRARRAKMLQRQKEQREAQVARAQRETRAQKNTEAKEYDAYQTHYQRDINEFLEFTGVPSYVTVGQPRKRVQLAQKMVNSTEHSAESSRYAYCFLMGGVNEQDGKYKGMLYNILIASYILQKEGSIADVVVYVQMSADSKDEELPEEDSKLLKKMNIQVRYLPKPQIKNFHQIIMQKMVVLDLVEYRRVLFLDTDVMPLCNIDYLFELSDGPNAILKENLIIALSGSPANAGFFMLAPKPGALAALRKIVALQQERAKELPYPHFDERVGWGHVIRKPDKWWTINKEHSRRAWKFVGSHADQGLLYHWVKYVEQSVSIVSGVEVDNYGQKKGRDRVKWEKTLVEPFREYTCLPKKYEESFGELPTYQAAGLAPYRDFIHFLGGNKPWKKKVRPAVATNLDSATPEQYWFHMLRLLNHELEMNIDFDNWERIRRTPLGSLPKKHLMKQLMDANQTLVQT